MDFRELNYVLAIAKYQNISRAAEALYVSQPTLSKFLIGLESDLGIRLFRRLGHKYVLTYAGERYVDHALQIQRLKNDLDIELADIIKRDVGVLNVAFARMRCTYVLPGSLPAFKEKYPNVKVNVFEGSSDENDRRILNGQADIAFYSAPSELNPLMEYESLGEEELLICTGRDHPIGRFAEPNPSGKYPRLNPALLENELIIMMHSDQRTRQIADSVLQDLGIHFSNVLYTSNLPAIIELVARGYGISFVHETHLRHRSGDTPISCYSFSTGRIMSEFVAAYRKGSYIPKYARDYIELIRSLQSES
ncbi:MAG: LysR family transcriptional regulator [Erysipelotrichaceae bacterium]|nr:LysR family transcriptional regulator [Erysipelotrichaceae bacterium]